MPDGDPNPVELVTVSGAGPGKDELTPAPARVQLGLIATPNLAGETLAQLGDELTTVLSERYPGVRWEVARVSDPLVAPPVQVTELVDAARTRLLDEGWDLAVYVTDLPLRLSRRPLLTHSSPTHGVALVSLPALGVRRVNRRLLDAAAEAVSTLLGDAPSRRAKDRSTGRRADVQRRLVELATDTEEGVTFLARVISGNIRLLLGMIRANQPWRLIGRLSRALLGALAAASYALVASDVWRIATSLNAVRLTALTVISIATAVVTLIAAHDLWERAEDRRVREQVALFNLVTVITVVFGIASLYAAVFVASLGAAALLIDSSLFTNAVGRSTGFWDYLRLAWLASSLATVGGALGGALETDSAVREAAYAYRPEDELS